jgi:hypothetical protein
MEATRDSPHIFPATTIEGSQDMSMSPRGQAWSDHRLEKQNGGGGNASVEHLDEDLIPRQASCVLILPLLPETIPKGL